MPLTCCDLQTRLAVDGSLQSSLAVTPIHCCSTQCLIMSNVFTSIKSWANSCVAQDIIFLITRSKSSLNSFQFLLHTWLLMKTSHFQNLQILVFLSLLKYHFNFSLVINTEEVRSISARLISSCLCERVWMTQYKLIQGEVDHFAIWPWLNPQVSNMSPTKLHYVSTATFVNCIYYKIIYAIMYTTYCYFFHLLPADQPTIMGVVLCHNKLDAHDLHWALLLH